MIHIREHIDVKSVIVEPHAIKRANERFKLKEKDAINMCKTIISTGKYLGETTCDRGNRGHLFSSGKKAVVLSMDCLVVKTVMDIDKKFIPNIEPTNPLHSKLIKLYDTELRKHDRVEQCNMKKVNNKKILFGVEIAELNLRIFKSRSAAVKEKCKLRLNELNNEIGRLESELKRIQDDKRKIAKARACLT